MMVMLTELMLKVGEFEKPRTKLLFYIVKYGPNNTKVVKLMTNKPSPGGKVGPKHDRVSCNSILIYGFPLCSGWWRSGWQGPGGARARVSGETGA